MKKIRLFAVAAMFSTVAIAQDSTVQMFGKIFNKKLEPIENVTVVLRGTKYKATTNEEGRYFFMLPAKKGTLIYSHEGYKTKENKFTGTPQATDLILIDEKEKRNQIKIHLLTLWQLNSVGTGND